MNEIATRYQTDEHAIVQFYGKAGTCLAHVKNISSSGACLAWTSSQFKMNPGDLLKITINLPKIDKQHTFAAEVIWTKPGVGGVHFIRQDEVLKKMMARI